ncbi:MAG TPA: RNA-processing protein [Archaeoglobaceae archaeon]|nr:RNA-processing protein [Archaeoglobaceae archaeon]
MQKIVLRIPEDRLGVIIGKDGSVKKRLEEETNCRIIVSSEGVVAIESEDAVGFLKAQDVIKAIGSGFSPEVAFKLLSDDFIILDVISLDFSPNNLQRIKGRIIGKGGKFRKAIEDMLGVNVSVHHKSVAIIGEIENVNAAREAINMIINGHQHSTVYRFLENKRREIKMKSLDWK